MWDTKAAGSRTPCYFAQTRRPAEQQLAANISPHVHDTN